MTQAHRVAGTYAVRGAGVPARPSSVDGNHNYLGLGELVTTVVKGDTKCLAVAAASCVAKVA